MKKIFSTALLGLVVCAVYPVRAQDVVISGYLSRLLAEHPSMRSKQFDAVSSDRLVTSAWKPITMMSAAAVSESIPFE